MYTRALPFPTGIVQHKNDFDMAHFMELKDSDLLVPGIEASFGRDLEGNLLQRALALLDADDTNGTQYRLFNLLNLCYCGSYTCPHHHARSYQGALKVKLQLNKALGIVNRAHLQRFYTEDELFAAIELLTGVDVEEVKENAATILWRAQ